MVELGDAVVMKRKSSAYWIITSVFPHNLFGPRPVGMVPAGKGTAASEKSI